MCTTQIRCLPRQIVVITRYEAIARRSASSASILSTRSTHWCHMLSKLALINGGRTRCSKTHCATQVLLALVLDGSTEIMSRHCCHSSQNTATTVRTEACRAVTPGIRPVMSARMLQVLRAKERAYAGGENKKPGWGEKKK